MKHLLRLTLFFAGLLALAFFGSGQAAQAQQNWHLSVGAETKDMGRQALAFLPDEVWIHAGDSITWTWQSDEIHTLSFLSAGQITPSFSIPFSGCPGVATSPATFDGSSCLTSDALVKGQTFTVVFTAAGNYKFECLVHIAMTGTVHVLDSSAPLPHDQAFYDQEAARERRALLTDTDAAKRMDTAMDGPGSQVMNDAVTVRILSSRDRSSSGVQDLQAGALLGTGGAGKNEVKAGVGETSSNAGGIQTSSLLRFAKGTITIHVGDTVEWTNHDPVEPHTITFGPEADDPSNPFPPSANVTLDADGAPHAILNSPTELAHSGAILQPFIDEPGLPNTFNTPALNPTRFRATFTQPGTYNYHCVFHDSLGMVGKVIVLP